MDKGLEFETLLRRVYQVGRYGKPGVDADEYRRLERAENLYRMDQDNIKNRKPRISTKSIDDLAYDYRVLCRKIWRLVSEAISFGLTKYKERFTEKELTELKECLIESEGITKEFIDKVIDKAEAIFVAHKIFPV